MKETGYISKLNTFFRIKLNEFKPLLTEAQYELLKTIDFGDLGDLFRRLLSNFNLGKLFAGVDITLPEYKKKEDQKSSASNLMCEKGCLLI
jgi:hypothetical protein